MRVPGGHGDLGESGQQHGRGQANEGNDWMFQEVHFTNQDVGGFGTGWDLLHEVHIHLKHGSLVRDYFQRIVTRVQQQF